MNQLFSPRRFAQYFGYELRTGAKKYALYFIAAPFAVMLMIVLYSIFAIDSFSHWYNVSEHSTVDPMHNFMQGLFLITFGVITLVAASMTFSMLSTKSGRISSLMVPASQLEKYIARWIMYVPVVILLSMVAFEVVDLLRCAILAVRYPQSVRIHPLGTEIFPFSLDWSVIVTYFMVSATCVLGSSIWPSMSLLKTIIANFVISMVFTAITSILMLNLISNMQSFVFQDINWLQDVDFVENAIYIFFLVYTAICYALAYFRFREIEIIQRW